jgi:hypothetical protein
MEWMPALVAAIALITVLAFVLFRRKPVANVPMAKSPPMMQLWMECPICFCGVRDTYHHLMAMHPDEKIQHEAEGWFYKMVDGMPAK